MYISATTWRQSFLLTENPLHKTKEKKIFDRSSTIPLIFLNTRVAIYNGNTFFKKYVNR